MTHQFYSSAVSLGSVQEPDFLYTTSTTLQQSARFYSWAFPTVLPQYLTSVCSLVCLRCCSSALCAVNSLWPGLHVSIVLVGFCLDQMWSFTALMLWPYFLVFCFVSFFPLGCPVPDSSLPAHLILITIHAWCEWAGSNCSVPWQLKWLRQPLTFRGRKKFRCLSEIIKGWVVNHDSWSH